METFQQDSTCHIEEPSTRPILLLTHHSFTVETLNHTITSFLEPFHLTYTFLT